MADLHTVWSAQGTVPRRMVTNKVGYPHSCWDPDDDSRREKQFDNTHFPTELEAAERCVREGRAGRQIRTSNYKEALLQVERATKALAEAAAEETEAEAYLERLKERAQ